MPALTEERLTDDLTRAMKARDMPRVYVLRGLLTSAKNLKVEKRGAALGEDELVQLVRKEIRKREEAEEFAVKAGRQELVAQNQAERALLEIYVPALLDATQLEQAIRALVAQSDGCSLGNVMSGLKKEFAGRYDGKQASEIAKRVLAEASPS